MAFGRDWQIYFYELNGMPFRAWTRVPLLPGPLSSFCVWTCLLEPAILGCWQVRWRELIAHVPFLERVSEREAVFLPTAV